MKSLPTLPIKLRGHHLICLHFFKGEGYNPEFIKNLQKIIERVEDGEHIEVYPGPDDICTMCPYLKDKICFYDDEAESEIKEMDRNALKLLGVKHLDKVLWLNIKNKIPEVFSQWSKEYCSACDWRKVCEAKIETAEDKF